MRLTVAVLILFLLPSVLGYGLASSYLEDNTMTLQPGEIKEYKVELQNNDPAKIEFSFNLESEIASVKDLKETYTVGGDQPIRTITLVIEVPKTASPGEEYNVKYSAIPQSSSDKTISLNLEFTNHFTVIVEEAEQPIDVNDSKNYLPIIVTLIIFILSLVLVFRKNNLLSKRIFEK